MTEASHWSWRNLQSGLAVGEASKLEAAFFQGSAPIELYRDVYYCTAGVILLFGLLAVMFRKMDVGGYRTLSDASRLIFVSHNVFLLIFVFTAIPYSYAMVSVLFAPSAPKNLLDKSIYRSISFSLAFQVVMYALEGGCRAVIRPNAFLLGHHIIFCTLSVLTFQPQSLFIFKINLVLSSFATYEFLLYAALIARKVPALHSSFRWLMVSGLGFYGMTRVVQIVLLVGLFVLNFGSQSHTSSDSALYWVGMIMTIALVVLQLYTFVIYRAIWRSTTGSGKSQMTRLKSHNLDSASSIEVTKSMELPSDMFKAMQLP